VGGAFVLRLPSLKQYGYLGLALAPFAVLCFFAALHAVNLPYWDEWEFARVLNKWFEGNLGWRDFFIQHNEHRLLFPRLLMFPLALLTHWNIYFEVALSILLGAGLYAVLALRILKLRVFSAHGRGWIGFAVSVLVFSVAQAESWLLGEQNQTFLNLLAFAAGIFMLTAPRLSPFKFAAILVCGIISTYSMANGMLFWPIGFAVLLVRPLDSRLRQSLSVIWTGVSILMLMSYLYEYHKPSHHPSLLFVFRQPLSAVKYFFAYLGFPLSCGRADGALWAGGAGFFIFLVTAGLCYPLFRKSGTLALSVLPWLGLGGYGLSCAVLTTVARAEWGVAQALALRYVPFSNLLWISLAVLVPFCIVYSKPNLPRVTVLILHSKIFRATCLILFLILTAGAAKVGWCWGKMHSEFRGLAKNYLLADYYDDYYFKRFLYPGDLRKRIAMMKKRRLACFNRSGLPAVLEAPVPLSPVPPVTNDVTYYLDEFIDRPGAVFLRGWAAVNGQNSRWSTISIVLQSASGTYIMRAFCHERRDVTDWFHRIADYDDSGFIANIPKIHLPKGEYRVGLFIQKGETRSLTYTPKRILI
jgi:hypothetical protein